MWIVGVGPVGPELDPKAESTFSAWLSLPADDTRTIEEFASREVDLDAVRRSVREQYGA